MERFPGWTKPHARRPSTCPPSRQAVSIGAECRTGRSVAFCVLSFISIRIMQFSAAGACGRSGQRASACASGRQCSIHASFSAASISTEFLDGLDLSGKSVADVGTGSGILALAAARAGAAEVLALDINPNAALSALENAHAHGFGDRVTVACMDLLAALPPLPLFDVILSNPPKHAGEPRDLADRGWHAGPQYRNVAALFEQARERLKADGCFYVMLSSDSDLDLLGRLIGKAGFRARLAYERSFYIESMILYELRT
jgi:SAM-dependent methyltransferase